MTASKMKNKNTLKDQLVKELTELSTQAEELKRSETGHKLAEEALTRSEQRYRLLFETMSQGVVYQDADGTIIAMNTAAEKILGKTVSEFVGSSSVKEERLTLREDGTVFPGLDHPSMVALRTGREVRDSVMGVYNPREKRYCWIKINAIPLFREQEQKPYQVYTVFEDISERKRAEEALRLAAETFEKTFLWNAV
jgi:PAS domain S-box-containing protein